MISAARSLTTNLKPQDFELQVGRFQQGGSFSLILGPNQHLQQFVKCAFQAFAEYETMISRKAAGVVATPEDQVVGLGDTTRSMK